MPRIADSRPLMKPCPAGIGSVVAIDRCAARGRSPGASATPRLCLKRRRAVTLFVAAIVVPRPHTGQPRDRRLQPPEEPDRLERPIAPAGRDAVMHVVRPIVMHGMLGAAENDTAA